MLLPNQPRYKGKLQCNTQTEPLLASIKCGQNDSNLGRFAVACFSGLKRVFFPPKKLDRLVGVHGETQCDVIILHK